MSATIRVVTATEAGPGLPARAWHLPTAAGVAVATAVLVGTAAAGEPFRLVAVAVLQVALVVAWVPATGIPARAGAPALGLAAAAGADLLLVLPERPEIGSLLAVPGLGLLAAVLHQMLRRAPRLEVVGSLAGVLLLLCAVSALAVVLLLPVAGDATAGTTALLAVGTALLVCSLVDLVLPRPPVAAGVPRGVPALVLAVLAGAAVAVVRHGVDDLATVLGALVAGLTLGSVAALVGLAAGYVVAGAPARAWAAPVLQTVLPFAAAAPVAFSLVLQNVL